jgi:hypothetical protein
MTKFNPENKKVLTYGECLGPAMEITNEIDAKQYLLYYVSFIQKEINKNPRDDMTAEQIAKTNLGYYAGYYGGGIICANANPLLVNVTLSGNNSSFFFEML